MPGGSCMPAAQRDGLRVSRQANSAYGIGGVCNLSRWHDAAHRHVKKRKDLSLLYVLNMCDEGQSRLPGTLYRHGLEFTVTGSYGDLYEYLRSLESMPTQLYWRRAELSVSSYPLVTLKVTAFTVSFDRAWLIV